MKLRLRTIFWIEAMIAFFSALLTVATIEWGDWIERIFDIDADHHSGSIEWQWVIALSFSAALFAALARREYHGVRLAKNPEE
jgi:hypothetical protein